MAAQENAVAQFAELLLEHHTAKYMVESSAARLQKMIDSGVSHGCYVNYVNDNASCMLTFQYERIGDLNVAPIGSKYAGSVWETRVLNISISFPAQSFSIVTAASYGDLDVALSFYKEINQLAKELLSMFEKPVSHCILTSSQAEEVAKKYAQETFLARQNGELNVAISTVRKGLKVGGNSKFVARPSYEFVPDGTYNVSFKDGSGHPVTYQVIVGVTGAEVKKVANP